VALRDISVALRAGTPEWPGDTPFDCRWSWRIAQGDSVNVSAISGSPHVGTHADAPLHVRDGWPGSDELPVEAFVGYAWVVDVGSTATAIDIADLVLPSAGEPVERLLLRTGRTIADGAFPEQWPALTAPAIDALLARGLKLVGVDCPSVDERESKALANHHQLFSGGCSILENLDLRGVAAGRYELLAQPLKLQGLDAAPVRALLRDLPGP
jgi:arylformamidase